MTEPQPLLPTSVVGSYARPGWLYSGLEAAKRGEFGPADMKEMLDDAVDLALRDQEEAGVDIVTDGEMRRAGFFTAEFYTHLTELRSLPPDRQQGPAGHDQHHRFEVLEPTSAPNGLGVVADYAYARRRTARPLKVTLPGPFTLAGRLVPGRFYPDRVSAAWAFASILNAELKALVAAGATFIQIDEPSPAIRPESPVDFAGLFNAAVEHVDARLAAHLCFGNFAGRPLGKRQYAPVLDQMMRYHVEQLVLEFANRELAELKLLNDIAAERDVAAGVIDVKSYHRNAGRCRGTDSEGSGACARPAAHDRARLWVQPDRSLGVPGQAAGHGRRHTDRAPGAGGVIRITHVDTQDGIGMGTANSDTNDLLDRVAQADVRPGELALWYTGGAGYIVKSVSVTILIDPYVRPDHPPNWVRSIPPAFDAERLGDVTAVMLTHEHDDHTDPVALDAIRRRTAAGIFGPESSITVARSTGVLTGRCHTMEPEQSVRVGDLLLSAIPVYDPLAQGCLGWVIETGAVTLLHCGDSLYFPGFVDLGRRWDFDAICVSVGLNPPGASFYMDESDAARSARDAGAKVLIAQHFDLWERTKLDPSRVATVARWYCPDTRVLPARFCHQMTLTSDGMRT